MTERPCGDIVFVILLLVGVAFLFSGIALVLGGIVTVTHIPPTLRPPSSLDVGAGIVAIVVGIAFLAVGSRALILTPES